MPTVLAAPARAPHRRGPAPWLVRFLAPGLAVLQLCTIVAELIAAAAFVPRYNWVTNTISELGVSTCTTEFDPRSGVEACSPLADLMNGAMVVSGISLVLLALVLFRSRGFSGVAGVLWVIAGLGSIATGFVALDSSSELHQLVSMPLFFGGPLAIALGAFQFRGGVRLAGIILGGIALALGVLFSTTDLVYGIGGLIERLVIWPSLAWVLVLAILASRQAREAARQPGDPEPPRERR
ncbi:DUF998 domain-containing protein [Leucobacter sp. M11]|uniref:DUF998 domain-containing protein n=1 Tax=Leucobacter sp. M11 TaxID=2993565 RepID=UPI002D803006|nr:DUF998 domain-containing protein [Leucobacter sp. M11]MEB4615850.1 DUF998 domain-containing protein [Leucobacter sp. M11]